MFLEPIHTPTLILDPGRCRSNILQMAEKATSAGITLRPHFKTHQSRLVGRWFRETGHQKITVSSVGMARYFMEDGWDDILIAFPVNVRQLREIGALAEKIRLGILVVDQQTVRMIGQSTNVPLHVWIKLDVGTHRTGVNPSDQDEIFRIVGELERHPQLHFEGFIAHAGHSYKQRSVTGVQHIYDETLEIMLRWKSQFQMDYPGIQISLGDTPGASMVSHFGPVDELRPGNYTFYDLMQAQIGACTPDDIAVAMACPVVAVHPERLQWVIYGGAIHFSKDSLLQPDGTGLFGRMVREDNDTWNVEDIGRNPWIISLSQEHGVVQCTPENFHWHKPGDISLWLPVHSCLTADAMGGYITTEGMEIDHYRRHVYDL